MKYDVIITAAGSGLRSGLAFNKVFFVIGGKPCFMHCVDFFLEDLGVGKIYLVVDAKQQEQFMETLKQFNVDLKRVVLVYGGATRQQSVFAALKLVKAFHVLVHDAARPFIDRGQVDALIKTLVFEKAAILAILATDTLKQVDAFKQVNLTIERTKVYYAQTPQGFNTDVLYRCHTLAALEEFEATDDAQLLEYEGSTKVQVVEGSCYNMKITTPEDVKMAQLYYAFLTNSKEELA
ncbi:MAG: 2-C-methyl-D-erythritol 4-phosphate cytidylyltransferase [Culicoidibacterales bacterium]